MSSATASLKREHQHLKNRLEFINRFNISFRVLTNKNRTHGNENPRELIRTVNQIQDLLKGYVANREQHHSVDSENPTSPCSPLDLPKSRSIDGSKLEEILKLEEPQLLSETSRTRSTFVKSTESLPTVEFLQQLRGLSHRKSGQSIEGSQSARDHSSFDNVVDYALKKEIRQMKQMIDKWEHSVPSMLAELMHLCATLDAKLKTAATAAAIRESEKSNASVDEGFPSMPTSESLFSAHSSIGIESTASSIYELASPEKPVDFDELAKMDSIDQTGIIVTFHQ